MPDAGQVLSRRNNLNSSDCLALLAQQSEQFRLFGSCSGGCEKQGCAGRSGCTKRGVPDKCTPEIVVGAILYKSVRLFDHHSFRAVGIEHFFQKCFRRRLLWWTMELLQCQNDYGIIPALAAVPLMFHRLRSLPTKPNAMLRAQQIHVRISNLEAPLTKTNMQMHHMASPG